jgi:type IV secretory pathway VirJ component
LFSFVVILRGKCDQSMKAHLIVIATVMLLTGVAVAGEPTRLNHGRFKDVMVYAPAQAPTRFALLLSGDGGWGAAEDALAKQLVDQGAMVTGIDTAQFKAALQIDAAHCVFPDGDLENLSHFVQAYFHNATYHSPWLVGVSEGAQLAYAVLAQAPRDTFAGALTLGFCPTLHLDKALCKGSGLEFSRAARTSGVDLLPIKSLSNPWVNIQTPQGLACPPATVLKFVSQVQGAAMASAGTDLKPFNAAFAKLTASRSSARIAPPPAALGDLPVVEVAAQSGSPPSDAFAIMMSGDGGWAGLDQDIAAALSAKGIPVVGLDSLRYYWTARTPEGLAADTDRMIRYYLSRLGKKRVLLIGYSQGADVLPFAVNRLPDATRSQVSLMAILGMSEHALFEFHVSSWISDDNSGPLTLPEVNRIGGIPVLCIYGEDEHDSLCPSLDSKRFTVVKVKGGHHFDGDYAGLANHILAAAKP